MRWPLVDKLLDHERTEEWREVPIQDVIKHTFGAFFREGFEIETIDRDHFPEEDGVIVAANHASYFDPIFLGATLDRPVHYMAKADLFRHPVTDFFFQKAGQIKVDRVSGGNEAAVDACVRLVGRDRCVGIFPEGRRTLDGSLRRGRTGVARVAMRSGAPVVPVALTSYEIMPKYARVPDLDKPLVIAFGEPRRYPDMDDMAQDRGACRKVTDEIMDEIGRLLEVGRTRQRALAMAEGG